MLFVIQGNTKNKYRFSYTLVLKTFFFTVYGRVKINIKFDLFYIFSCVYTFYFTNSNLRKLKNSDSTVVICETSVFDNSGLNFFGYEEIIFKLFKIVCVS